MCDQELLRTDLHILVGNLGHTTNQEMYCNPQSVDLVCLDSLKQTIEAHEANPGTFQPRN